VIEYSLSPVLHVNSSCPAGIGHESDETQGVVW
jgi:hypothetical protein